MGEKDKELKSYVSLIIKKEKQIRKEKVAVDLNYFYLNCISNSLFFILKSVKQILSKKLLMIVLTTMI